MYSLMHVCKDKIIVFSVSGAGSLYPFSNSDLYTLVDLCMSIPHHGDDHPTESAESSKKSISENEASKYM